MDKDFEGKILQIIPAQPGWMAVPYGGKKEAAEEIICWALMENAQGQTFVQGMVSDAFRFDLVYAGSLDDQIMYLSPSEFEEWKNKGAL